MTLPAALRPSLISRVLLTAFFSVAAVAAVSTSASADEVSFLIRNSHPNAMVVELYSHAGLTRHYCT